LPTKYRINPATMPAPTESKKKIIKHTPLSVVRLGIGDNIVIVAYISSTLQLSFIIAFSHFCGDNEMIKSITESDLNY